MEGMVNLAFILLGAKAAKGRETVAEKLWKFGGFILVKLIKKHNEATSTVLQRLIDCIISGQTVTQYTGEQCDITWTTADAVSNMTHVICRSWNMCWGEEEEEEEKKSHWSHQCSITCIWCSWNTVNKNCLFYCTLFYHHLSIPPLMTYHHKLQWTNTGPILVFDCILWVKEK